MVREGREREKVGGGGWGSSRMSKWNRMRETKNSRLWKQDMTVTPGTVQNDATSTSAQPTKNNVPSSLLSIKSQKACYRSALQLTTTVWLSTASTWSLAVAHEELPGSTPPPWENKQTQNSPLTPTNPNLNSLKPYKFRKTSKQFSFLLLLYMKRNLLSCRGAMNIITRTTNKMTGNGQNKT